MKIVQSKALLLTLKPKTFCTSRRWVYLIAPKIKTQYTSTQFSGICFINGSVFCCLTEIQQWLVDRTACEGRGGHHFHPEPGQTGGHEDKAGAEGSSKVRGGATLCATAPSLVSVVLLPWFFRASCLALSLKSFLSGSRCSVLQVLLSKLPPEGISRIMKLFIMLLHRKGGNASSGGWRSTPPSAGRCHRRSPASVPVPHRELHALLQTEPNPGYEMSDIDFTSNKARWLCEIST